MSKTVLKFDADEAYDFLLIGIVCHQKDYRLCHELNQRLSLNLARQEDYELFTPKHVKASKFPLYKCQTDEGDIYYVFTNKSVDDVLIPEQHQMDYFMMIQENFKRIAISELITAIRNIDLILGAYPIDAKSLKSKEHFLF